MKSSRFNTPCRLLGIAALSWFLSFSLSTSLCAQEVKEDHDEQEALEVEITDKGERKEVEEAAVAKPVNGDPVQVFGWREKVYINDSKEPYLAKLDTGARTSSIHAEDKEMFERDGKKWMRFVLTDPTVENSPRVRAEAALARIVHIKEPGGKSTPREVVKLKLKIGDRKLQGEFTLNNRNNMLAPVLIGRSMLKELGWVDPARSHLADKKIFR